MVNDSNLLKNKVFFEEKHPQLKTSRLLGVGERTVILDFC